LFDIQRIFWASLSAELDKPVRSSQEEKRRGFALLFRHQAFCTHIVNSGEESPLSQLHTRTSGEESSKPGISNWESDYLWYIWNIFSIISMIRLFWKYLGRGLQNKQAQTQPLSVTCTAAEVLLPDSDTLHRFHSKCIQVLSDEKVWEDTFLEGFAHDLVDAMKTICEKSYGMVIEDFQMVDVCDIIVPINPPDPRRFQCLLGNNQGSDLLPDAQVYGRIKLSSDTDDMLCLLHCETENVGKKTDVCVSLCVNSFLSKTQVTRWFLNTIKQAWALISHMYGFELIIRYIHAPGTLVVRFRSGKKIIFTMKPVVKFNTDSFFSVTPCTPSSLDTFWTLSLANYEDSFLKQISKRLPEHSCHSQTLEIAYFLHRRQTALSGSSTLKDFHFKAALMHQLLTKNPLEWKPNYLACRLRDLLDFMEKSLERKLLRHVLIGNPLTQKVIELRAEFMQADPVNLFHPLVLMFQASLEIILLATVEDTSLVTFKTWKSRLFVPYCLSNKGIASILHAHDSKCFMN
uniref:Inositol 1,4,5-trisphosphate receptor-interacting protein n=1 Tax=Mola mola TaxID=94237 RepID=A0A3Q3WCH4_MOLML